MANSGRGSRPGGGNNDFAQPDKTGAKAFRYKSIMLGERSSNTNLSRDFLHMNVTKGNTLQTSKSAKANNAPANTQHRTPGPSELDINHNSGHTPNPNNPKHGHSDKGGPHTNHMQPNNYYKGSSVSGFSCPVEKENDLYCCQPEHKACCSSDPNCHMFKNMCSPLSFDSFPNPFRQSKRTNPAWIAHCGKVLRFYAFYQEPVPESMIENYRVHQCEIRFYLDDGTIEVYEPKTFDPGFIQGRVIKRHKIPMPAPSHNAFYTLEDLNVGCQIQFYGKTFFIVGVDDMTRMYLNRREGRHVLPNMEMPRDLYTDWREDRILSLFARRPSINLDSDKFKKFLANTGKVLRFWAYWDDRCAYGGQLKQYLFHYYLEDDSVEILEIVDPDEGIRGAVTFLRRGKLLKNHKDLVPMVGVREDAILILNTVSSGNFKCLAAPSFMSDRLCPGVDEKECITDRDLAIGAVINVYERPFILVDCDKATRIYYREKYGVEDFTPLVLDKSEKRRELPRMEVPPHNGIGDETDTLKNWDKLEPTPPRKMIDIQISDKDILCFEAKFYNPLNKVNTDRRFIIKIFMIDNTMQIFEKPHPNTGFKGQFLGRCKVRRGPRPSFELGEESEYYVTADYFMGNILDINGFSFILTGADEFTLNYMEANPNLFPQANFCLIIEKTSEAFGPLEGESVLRMFSAKDSQLNGIMSMDDFKSILITLTKEGLNEHEIRTLIRAFKVESPNVGPDFKTLQSVIQTELQRYNFDHFLLARVEYTLRYHDPCRLGHVDKETLGATLKGAKLPLDRVLVDYLMNNFVCVDNCNRINYCALLRFLDWIHNPAPSASPAHISCVMKWLEPSSINRKVTCINYAAFLNLVNPNFRCDLNSICCPQPCKPCEMSSPYNQEYPCDDTYMEQRERAGYVINDIRVRPEALRCDDEDCGVYCKDPCVSWENSEQMSPEVVDAYLPESNPDDEDCINYLGEGNREYYKLGDHIGFEDMHPDLNRM